MKHIAIIFPKDRHYVGQLFVYDEELACFGPCGADGKADDAAAAAHGNPERNPESAFGDTPCGEFIGVPGYEEDSDANRRSFGEPDTTGKIPVIRLEPLAGDWQAWRRQLSEGLGVQMGLAIHAGPTNSSGFLRPTHGCCRVYQGDMKAILAQVAGLPSFRVSIQERQ